jgi:hypothetical protein
VNVANAVILGLVVVLSIWAVRQAWLGKPWSQPIVWAQLIVAVWMFWRFSGIF